MHYLRKQFALAGAEADSLPKANDFGAAHDSKWEEAWEVV
jgi:hypothetical protein